jgi:DNA-directed RNA polymerase specialized sigma24 family protein
MTVTEDVDQRERNKQLYDRMLEGDQAARESLITENLGLVGWHVGAVIARCPSLKRHRHDIESSGRIGLVIAVNSILAGRASPILDMTSYLSKSIRREVVRFLRSEWPDDPRVLEATEEKPDENKPEPTKEEVRNVARIQYGFNGWEPSFTPFNETDEVDLILSCCESDYEREIVQMRLDGYTDTEIAAKFNVTRPAITARRRVIFNRYRTKKEELEDE